MKITTPKSYVIESFGEPHLEITDALIDQLFSPINDNIISIFKTTSSIEWRLNKIISHYFYGPYNESQKLLRDRFESQILTSDWCSFASKRKLLLHIVKDLKLLARKDQEEYSRQLRKVMSYRNAFAHGQTVTDGRVVKLRYFEGNPMEVELNEAYFKNVEKAMQNCFLLTQKILSDLEIIKL